MDLFEEQLDQSLKHGFIHSTKYQNQLYSPKIVINRPKEGRFVLSNIQEELEKCQQFSFSIAFITKMGLGMLKSYFFDLYKRGGSGRILISPYLGFNDPKVMRDLLKLKKFNIEVRISKESMQMHSKIYLFENIQEKVVISGSSNLTESALKTNYEWNVKLSSTGNGQFIREAEKEFTDIWENSFILTEAIIKRYEQTRKPIFTQKDIIKDEAATYKIGDSVKPNRMQKEAMNSLSTLRNEGAERALVISATGTGKTYMAAFDVKQYNPKRFLFIVHREQILRDAKDSFQGVIGFEDKEACVYTSGMDVTSYKYVFATIQSISRDENLYHINRAYFDYILVDEVHKSGARTYQKLMDYFSPDFYLGMTATPERTDGKNIYELFNYNVAYEIRLQGALKEDMLSPFLYFAVTDITVDGDLIDEKTSFNHLTSEERVRHILEKTDYYGTDGEEIRGLIFCSNVQEAEELSRKLNILGCRTQALSGKNSQEEREEAIKRLESGELEYLLTVDIFNEGIDIPSLNQVVMLRNTQSAIVFVQQLGRGLRKHPNKHYMTIIDFIGNYKNNYLIPIALFGDKSGIKEKSRQYTANPNQITGPTTINFEKIAQEKVFESINKVTLSSIVKLRESYIKMRNRLGRTPWMKDFLLNDDLDPEIFLENNSFNHYGDVIDKFENDYLGLKKENRKRVYSFPDPYISKILRFMSTELLNGKRVHELLLINYLIKHAGVGTRTNFKSHLKKQHIPYNEDVILSSERVLSLSFFIKQAQDKYGSCFLKVDGDNYRLNEQFMKAWKDERVQHLVTDIIESGLIKSKNYEAHYPFDLAKRYSRKDAARLLNWENDESSTIYGYKIKHGTCPIFVTYHKSDTITAQTQYKDMFLNSKVFHWYSRSNVTLDSKEIQKIKHADENNLDIHLFIKKEEGEGTDHYYLGPVHPQIDSFEQTTQRNDKGQLEPIVHMNLELEHDVEHRLLQYLDNE